jgi:hypothetical protein
MIHFPPVSNIMSTCKLLASFLLLLISSTVNALMLSKEFRNTKTSLNFITPNIDYTPVPTISQSENTLHRKSTPLKLSPSLLSSCDTLPEFHTAHGLLSPETIMKLEKSQNIKNSPALKMFLNQYRNDGPMSCLCMLSDPEILPHLTSAMRDLL